MQVIENTKVAFEKLNYEIFEYFSHLEKMSEMPEDMPTPKKSLKELEREKKLLESNEKKIE